MVGKAKMKNTVEISVNAQYYASGSIELELDGRTFEEIESISVRYDETTVHFKDGTHEIYVKTFEPEVMDYKHPLNVEFESV